MCGMALEYPRILVVSCSPVALPKIALRGLSGFIALPKSKVQGHLEANAAFGFELTAPDAGSLGLRVFRVEGL